MRFRNSRSRRRCTRRSSAARRPRSSTSSPSRAATRSTAARWSSCATSSSMRATTSTIPTKPMPPLRQNQFGVNVGGPIRRDRTFFFFSYEGQRIRKAQTQTFSVPTAALRSGDFSGLRAALRSADAHRGRRLHAVCRQSDSGRAASSPVAQALLAKVPLPTSGGLVQNLLGVEDQVNPMNQFSLQDRPSASARATTCSAGSRRYRVRRHAAVRHQLAERSAGPGLRPDGDDQERERRPRLHAHVRVELAERGPLRLSRMRAAAR